MTKENIFYKSDLPKIADAIKNTVNKAGEIDEISQEMLEEEGLSKGIAESVMAIICEIDQFNPPISRVMRGISDLAQEA
jgi:hypothetical protein